MGGGEAMLAGDVDEGPPLRVGEVYAPLALCCRNQVTHDPIVLVGRPLPCRRGGTAKGYRPHSGENGAPDHAPFSQERPAGVIYSPQAKGCRKEESTMREDQSVAEMANEVLMRQAKARAQRRGEPIE